jgi:hypothetical protein
MSKKLTDEQIKAAAEIAGVEYAALKALAVVESSGAGFLDDGRPKILFEGHVFWKQLEELGLEPAQLAQGNEDILHSMWDKSKYMGGAAEHQRLERAATIDRPAALQSASWGLFQIMGFNWRLCGFKTLQDFVNAMYRDEASHLVACLGYLKGVGLIPVLRSLDWAAFAKGYNGPGYSANKYDRKLAKAYAEAKTKGW